MGWRSDAKLFDWLVTRINESLLTVAETRAFIGVLDIFGFEDFKVNSFEQLCINFANEKLQAHFNTQVFKQEQEIYIREAIRWDPIDEPDNQACIALLANRPPATPVGLFALLDEQCRLPKCTHKTFTLKLVEAHKAAVSGGVLSSPPRGSGLVGDEGFVIRHYAGQVRSRDPRTRQQRRTPAVVAPRARRAAPPPRAFTISRRCGHSHGLRIHSPLVAAASGPILQSRTPDPPTPALTSPYLTS